jgi:hypothetical protein
MKFWTIAFIGVLTLSLAGCERFTGVQASREDDTETRDEGPTGTYQPAVPPETQPPDQGAGAQTQPQQQPQQPQQPAQSKRAAPPTRAPADTQTPQQQKQQTAEEYHREIMLTAATDEMISGEAEIEADMEAEDLEQEIEIEGGQPNTDYQIIVHVAGSEPVELGTITTNNKGSAEVTFSTTPGEGRPFGRLWPMGKTVRDFESVEIKRGDTAVLRGTF